MPLIMGILASAGAAPGPTPVTGSYDLLETVELAADAASVSFTSLNSTYGSDYKHLQIRAIVKSTRSGSGEGSAGVKINGATTGYNSHRLRGDGSSVTSAYYTLQPMFYSSIARGDTANVYSPQIVDILDAFNTSKNTTIRSLCGLNDSDSIIALYSGLYPSTSAVDSLEFLDIATGDDWAAGSRFSLYGIKGA